MNPIPGCNNYIPNIGCCDSHLKYGPDNVPSFHPDDPQILHGSTTEDPTSILY